MLTRVRVQTLLTKILAEEFPNSKQYSRNEVFYRLGRELQAVVPISERDTGDHIEFQADIHIINEWDLKYIESLIPKEKKHLFIKIIGHEF